MTERGKRNWKDHEETLTLPSHISLHEEDCAREDDGESDLAVIIPAHRLSRDKLYGYLEFLELVYNTRTELHVYKTGTARIRVEASFQKSYVGFKVAGWLYKIPWSIYKKTSRGRL